jgi:ParB family transcriptional regulator, chromosome partitioning protein
MAVKKRGLGRGLDALLGNTGGESAPSAGTAAGERLKSVPVARLAPGPFQPRKDMDPERLRELADSISAQGLVQPVTVREVGEGFEIIAGERRWRAAQLAGITEIPVIVRKVSDQAAMAIALIENIQREDLNAMEEAEALKRLLDEYRMTHQQLADTVGKSRAAVSNLLRLNELVPEVKGYLSCGQIEMGHARALLGISTEGQSQLARQIVERELTVRQVEAMVQDLRGGRIRGAEKAVPPAKHPDIKRLEADISEELGALVTIDHGAKGNGKIVIRYGSLDELDGVLGHIRKGR